MPVTSCQVNRTLISLPFQANHTSGRPDGNRAALASVVRGGIPREINEFVQGSSALSQELGRTALFIRAIRPVTLSPLTAATPGVRSAEILIILKR